VRKLFDVVGCREYNELCDKYRPIDGMSRHVCVCVTGLTLLAVSGIC